MHARNKRVIAYSTTAAVAAGLCYAGFVYEPAPDPANALLQAEIKLRFASRLPSANSDGKPVPAREAMIAEAVKYIDEAERIAPPSAVSLEYRGYVEWLRGDAKAAASCYSRARALAADATASSALVLAEARMRAMSGEEPAALRLLQDELPRMTGPTADRAVLDMARIHIRNERRDQGLGMLRDLVSRADSDVLIEAGELFEDAGHAVDAEQAYVKCAASVSIANYFAARLKARKGDVDNALGLLESSEKDDSQSVRMLVRRDARDWRVCAETERFKKLFPEKEAAAPGR